MEFKSYMFSRIVAALVVVMLSGFAWADKLELKPGQVLDEETVNELQGLQYEHQLFLHQSDDLHDKFMALDKSCGTAAQFKTEACFKRFKAIVTELKNSPE